LKLFYAEINGVLMLESSKRCKLQLNGNLKRSNVMK
jgi:hypothetical protein